ncbi:sigma-70 family RNA polymerase sigma factor [Variovorax sp. PCZ-1]|nr:sigma-70 family RNA polymerase sigma factor [Variovorax sp. PCZ-1]MBS7807882.1 sigma-70 family RNA polymerase sigma factor [Variovorax sp. PCZ-1]
MQRYAQGDVAAFEVLLKRHETALWRFIVKSLRDAAAAEDVMQDTWITVTQQAARYVENAVSAEQTAQFRTWLFTLARSRTVDHLRKQKPEVSTEDFSNSQSDWLGNLAADSGFGPLRQLEGREQAGALLQALQELPDDQREAFLLQAEGGLSVEEIAASCQVSFETAKSRLRYARSKLKAYLAAWSPERQGFAMQPRLEASS